MKSFKSLVEIILTQNERGKLQSFALTGLAKISLKIIDRIINQLKQEKDTIKKAIKNKDIQTLKNNEIKSLNILKNMETAVDELLR